MATEVLSGKSIVLGIAGGIAAYKSAEVCSALVKAGASVHVVMTEHATRFVGPVTFRALTGRQVITSMWDEPREYEIAHVSLPDKADLVLIAPATANIIGKVANGIADDMLSTTIMATKAPVLLAPAMNNKMWENPVVKSNVERLESLGYLFIGPESGRLACGVEAIGRMCSPTAIVRRVIGMLAQAQDFAGARVLVAAGPTEEPIDPVRFVSNRSSGKMGYAIAQAAAERGAEVCLVSGPTSLKPPPSVELLCVRTAEEMLGAVMDRLPEYDIVVGAAAVADYTPKAPASGKIKKTGAELTLELTPTKDIIAEVGRHKDAKILVGFAAETENLVRNARAKLEKKNMDFIVANDVSKPGIGFESDVNEVTVISDDGTAVELPRLSKLEIAHRILDLVKSRTKESRATE